MPPRPAPPPPPLDQRCFPRPAEPVVDPEMPPVVHPGDEALHPFLRFIRAEDRTDRDHLLAQAAQHGYHQQRYIVWSSLRAISLLGRAETLCGPHWKGLFSISDSVCQELAIEFFSTIHMVTPLTDYAREDALTFRLGGEERRLSLRQFAVFMGLYTEAELDTPAFTEGITEWPAGVTAHEFWPEVGTGFYGSPIPKSTRITDPLHRLIHRAIVHSFTSRGDSSGTVTQTDLFYLYCMVRGRPCQIAERLATFLFRVRRQTRVSQGIYGGGFVTHLARAMGIIPEEDTPDFTFHPQAIPIDQAMLVRMGMARRIHGRCILLDSRGRDWDPHRPLTPPRDLGGDAGAGPSTAGDVGASSSGAAQEPIQTEIPSLEAPSQPLPPSPPRQRQPTPPRQDPPIHYSRTYTERMRRIEDDISGLRATVAEMSEIQALEYAHAEAHREFITRMLMRQADPSPSGPLPQPPVPPQRLRDFYARVRPASTSETHQQPPL